MLNFSYFLLSLLHCFSVLGGGAICFSSEASMATPSWFSEGKNHACNAGAVHAGLVLGGEEPLEEEVVTYSSVLA